MDSNICKIILIWQCQGFDDACSGNTSLRCEAHGVHLLNYCLEWISKYRDLNGFKCMTIDQRREWAFCVSVRQDGCIYLMVALNGLNAHKFGWILLNKELNGFKCMQNCLI